MLRTHINMQVTFYEHKGHKQLDTSVCIGKVLKHDIVFIHTQEWQQLTFLEFFLWLKFCHRLCYLGSRWGILVVLWLLPLESRYLQKHWTHVSWRPPYWLQYFGCISRIQDESGIHILPLVSFISLLGTLFLLPTEILTRCLCSYGTEQKESMYC